MTKAYRPYTLDQQVLLPPDMGPWLREGDLALFIRDGVDELDLAAIYRSYETGDGRGQPPYEPAMMVKVLLYAYCTGLRSSRKIEQATYRDVAIRVLAGDQHPDHDSIAEFRKRHLPARSEEHTSELQSLAYLVCRLLLEKKKNSIHMLVPLEIAIAADERTTPAQHDADVIDLRRGHEQTFDIVYDVHCGTLRAGAVLAEP